MRRATSGNGNDARVYDELLERREVAREEGEEGVVAKERQKVRAGERDCDERGSVEREKQAEV